MNQTLPVFIRDLTRNTHHDCASWTPGVEKSNDFRRDKSFLAQCNTGVMLNDLPRWGKLIDAALASGAEIPTPDVVDGLLNPLPPRLFRYWVEGARNSDPTSTKALRQMVHLFAKLEVSRNDLAQQAIDGFVERNQALAHITFDEDLLSRARLYAGAVLHGLDLENIFPKHGPGAVADGRMPWDKMRFGTVYESWEGFYPPDSYFFLSLTHFLDSYDSWHPEYKKSGCSRLCCVPKDFRGPRLIAAEPVENQWLQQGQFRALAEHLERSPYTRGHINFTDQNVNRDLALRSSMDGFYSTLDLKDASDMVSFKLAKSVIPEQWFQYLNATRSTHCRLQNGETIELNMMSTMGSAVCFPIEAFVFHCLLVAGRAGTLCRGWLARCQRISRHVFVYGDDLIVPTADAVSAIAILESVGLKVNKQKCCVGPHFRESCGMDAFRGQDITPVRIKRMPDHRAPESLPAATDQYNLMVAKGLYRSASFLREATERVFGPVPSSIYPLPCTYRARSIADVVDENSRIRSRWNHRLQKREYLIKDVSSVFTHRAQPGWSLAFASILYGLKVDSRGYPIPHRARLTTRWSTLY